MATAFQVTFDSADPGKLSAFWASALGYVEQPPPQGYADWNTWAAQNGVAELIGAWGAIVDPDGVGPRIFIQKVPEPKTAKNRMHLDLNVSDTRRVGQEEGRKRVDAEVRRLIGLGAAKVRVFDKHGEYWTVMADPEGNEFCTQ